MNRKGQAVNIKDIVKLIGVLIVSFLLLSFMSVIFSAIQDIQASIYSIVALFIPLIIIAFFFELVRRVFR